MDEVRERSSSGMPNAINKFISRVKERLRIRAGVSETFARVAFERMVRCE